MQRVLTQVHSECSITAIGARILATMVDSVLERIVKCAVDFAAEALLPKALVDSRDIQTAVRTILPGELAKHAVSEGTKAVLKVNP
jgi:histone H2B